MSIAASVVKALTETGLTIACAETLTGGGITQALIRVPGSSRVLGYSAVVYSDRAKTELLGVDPETIRRFVPEKTVTMPVNPEDEAAEENVILWEDRLNLYGIDTRLALERCAGSAGEFQMRAGLFEEYCEDTLRRLKESAGTEGYYLQIHSLKSAAKGIGARLLAEIAKAVEIRHDREFSEASHEILLREVERVRKGVRLFLRGGEP